MPISSWDSICLRISSHFAGPARYSACRISFCYRHQLNTMLRCADLPELSFKHLLMIFKDFITRSRNSSPLRCEKSTEFFQFSSGGVCVGSLSFLQSMRGIYLMDRCRFHVGEAVHFYFESRLTRRLPHSCHRINSWLMFHSRQVHSLVTWYPQWL